MATRVDNTMIEWEQKMLKNIAEAKLLSDADMAFLVTLENMILDHAKGRSTEAQQAAGIQQGPTMGGGPSVMNGSFMRGPAMPGNDELNRMLAGASGPQ